MPALFTQPYWHLQDGFPRLLEVPATGWHCNLLFNTGHQSDGWKPGPSFVDGTILEKFPTTVKEGFGARRKELQYAIDNNLIYVPAMHPWSVYRFDSELTHLEQLIEMSKGKNVPIMNCRQLYDMYQQSATGRNNRKHQSFGFNLQLLGMVPIIPRDYQSTGGTISYIRIIVSIEKVD